MKWIRSNTYSGDAFVSSFDDPEFQAIVLETMIANDMSGYFTVSFMGQSTWSSLSVETSLPKLRNLWMSPLLLTSLACGSNILRAPSSLPSLAPSSTVAAGRSLKVDPRRIGRVQTFLGAICQQKLHDNRQYYMTH
jgi:hypothetical protein